MRSENLPDSVFDPFGFTKKRVSNNESLNKPLF